MAWVFVPGLGCSRRPSKQSLLNTELFVTSSGTAMRKPYSWRGWKKRPWSKRLFGMISQPLMAGLGVEKWISSLPGYPARNFHSPENGRETQGTELLEKTAAVHNTTSSESFPSVAPPWSSSKTWQLGFDLLTNGFDLSARNYADWVTRSLSQSLSLQEMLARVTRGSGYSSWPSPISEDSESCGNHPNQNDSWPTPNVPSGGGRTTNVGGHSESGRKIQKELEATAKKWQTPRSNEAGDWQRDKGARGKERLTSQWPTPNASLVNDGEDLKSWEARKSRNMEKGINGNGMGTPLTIAAQNWPSPQAKDHRSGETIADYGNSRPLNEAVLKFSHPVPVMDPSGRIYSKTHRTLRRRLNPVFVCWLMGWPMWWTRAEPTSFGAQETELWRFKLRWLLKNFFGEP